MAFSNLRNGICTCEYIQNEIPLLSFIPPSPFFEHLFICLSNSCEFSFHILCSYLYQGPTSLCFLRVLPVLDNAGDLIPIFHQLLDFIQDIFCGTKLQNADVFMSPLGWCFIYLLFILFIFVLFCNPLHRVPPILGLCPGT